jgi:hypothetical protein
MTLRRRSGSRLAAALLIVVACADITADAACDPIGPPRPASSAPGMSAAAGPVDPCADRCVPDCFCCSRSETAGPALILPGLAALAQAPAASPASVPAVVLPVPEPPPLAAV